MSALPSIPVLIPSYQGREALLACIESVLASRDVEVQLLVVDDGSTDGSAGAVRERFPTCEVLEHGENRGFASACNTGIEALLARDVDRILLLNQDTLVAPDTLGKLHAFLDAHPSAGVVGPKTFSCTRAACGGERLLYAGSWRSRLPLRQRIPGIEQVEPTPSHDSVQTDYVWGHGMLLRTDALRAAGPFDPAFPMYYEDLDLCARVRAAGFELWCDRSAVVWHDIVDGARASSSEFWRWACKVESVGIYHRKHHARLAALALTPMTVLAEVLQLLRHGKWTAARHLALAGLRRAIGRRNAVRPSPAAGA